MDTGIERALTCRALAGKLERKAMEYETTAAALRRAAAKFKAGQHMALADVLGVTDRREYFARNVTPAVG